MADRISARLFAKIFSFTTSLSAGQERDDFVRNLLALTNDCDFRHVQMDADAALEALGAEQDEDGWWHMPKGWS